LTGALGSDRSGRQPSERWRSSDATIPVSAAAGAEAKRCCGIERGPSEQSLARAFVSQAARAAVLDLGPIRDDDFDMLCDRLDTLPARELSLQLELPKIFPPALDRLLDAMEQDDVDAGEVPFRELVDKLDTPPERARLARAVIALRETGRLERELAAVRR
jgi:hypothetical protein